MKQNELAERFYSEWKKNMKDPGYWRREEILAFIQKEVSDARKEAYKEGLSHGMLTADAVHDVKLQRFINSNSSKTP